MATRKKPLETEDIDSMVLSLESVTAKITSQSSVAAAGVAIN